MPKDGFKKLNVFLASPSDVATEKARLISIVDHMLFALRQSCPERTNRGYLLHQ